MSPNLVRLDDLETANFFALAEKLIQVCMCVQEHCTIPRPGNTCTCMCSLDFSPRLQDKNLGEEGLGSRLAYMYVWQSCLEIEYYSVVYFDCVTAFEPRP